MCYFLSHLTGKVLEQPSDMCCSSPLGGVPAEEAVHGHECGAELCGAGGLYFPGFYSAERFQCVGIPADDELWEAHQRTYQGNHQHGHRGSVSRDSRGCPEGGRRRFFRVFLE